MCTGLTNWPDLRARPKADHQLPSLDTDFPAGHTGRVGTLASPCSGLREILALDPHTCVTSLGPSVLSRKCLDGRSELCPHPERTENTGPPSALGRTECLRGPSGPTQKPLRAGGRFR